MNTRTKYPNGSIYLSGGMQFAEDLGQGWRQVVGGKLKSMGFYPLDIAALDVAYTNEYGHLYRDLVSPDEVSLRKSNIRKHFIDTDIALIRNDTDALIVLYDESVRLGAGTTSEVHDAFMMDMPVFLVNAYRDPSKVPGWMAAETTKMFNEWDELYQYFAQLPPGILVRDAYGNRRSGTKYLCSLCGAIEEKHGAHYVSKITPSYCKQCVDVVASTFEGNRDRYEFCKELIERDMCREGDE